MADGEDYEELLNQQTNEIVEELRNRLDQRLVPMQARGTRMASAMEFLANIADNLSSLPRDLQLITEHIVCRVVDGAAIEQGRIREEIKQVVRESLVEVLVERGLITPRASRRRW